jgi:hypothetical protein
VLIFEVFTAVRMLVIFWALTPYRLTGRRPENGDNIFLRNYGLSMRVYMASKHGIATTKQELN